MIDPAVLALALVAGAAAAVNPCGFALLPACLGLVVSTGGQDARGAATLRAVRFAAGVLSVALLCRHRRTGAHT